MIPQRGPAFLAPFFGIAARSGKDISMTKYFLKDTPLAGLERQMMTPPYFSPRGGGQTILCRFRYRPEDVVCKHCTEYRRGGCTEEVCPWLEERVEAGAVTYASLAAEFYRKWRETELGERIRELLHASGPSPTMTTAMPAGWLFTPYSWPDAGAITGHWRRCTC